MRHFWKEPFFHFILIGAVLFIIYGQVNNDMVIDDDTIVISQDKVENLKMLFEKTWQRSPTEEELLGLIEDHLKEEVFYREALRIGLDGDDIIIRRRMRQKMEFVAEDFASSVEPTTDELTVYLNENQEKFQIPEKFSFRHVYLNPDKRGSSIEPDMAELVGELNRNDAEYEHMGDPLMIERAFHHATPFEIRQAFGDGFANALTALPADTWTGPLVSGFGLHAVIIDDFVPGRLPQLEEVRGSVEQELMNERRLETLEAFYQGLRSNYTVIIEDEYSLD